MGPTRASAGLRVAALGVALATFVAVVLLSGGLSAERVRSWVDGYGAAGPLVFIAVSASLTVFLFPGPVLAAASGLLFGTALGTPVSIASATLGATLAFSLSRWWAHDAVVALAGPRLAALRAWVGRRGFLTVLYARIAPGVPYTLVNYAAGLTPILLRSFVAATAIGVAPRAFAYTALGGSLGDLRSPEALVAVAVLVGMAAGGLALARRDLRRAGPAER
ncbi:MAG TPA: TVP38/TMEM64 family protein [Solirubrobacteraceae bacterium]|nr:TVP38/TMEM64 family protein [Solirubrobacteraceae bacterium]